MAPSNSGLVEAVRLGFGLREERISRCINDDLDYLTTDTIRLAERTLETLDWCRVPEGRGNVWRRGCAAGRLTKLRRTCLPKTFECRELRFMLSSMHCQYQ